MDKGCPVCGKPPKQTMSKFKGNFVCPTYHYMFERSRYLVQYTIFLGGSYITWIIPDGGQKYCDLNWNYKSQRIAWLDIHFPVNLNSLKERIQKLLLFL